MSNETKQPTQDLEPRKDAQGGGLLSDELSISGNRGNDCAAPESDGVYAWPATLTGERPGLTQGED